MGWSSLGTKVFPPQLKAHPEPHRHPECHPQQKFYSYRRQNTLSKAEVDSEQIPIRWGQRYQPTCTCKQDRCGREARHQSTVPSLGWEDLGLLGPPGAAGPETWLGEAEVTSLGYHKAPCCPLPSAHASGIDCRVSSVCSWHPCSQYLWAEETRQPVRPGQGGPFVPKDGGGSLFLFELSLHPCSLPSDDWKSDCSGHSSPGSSVLPTDTGATAPLLGNPTVSISLWTSKQGDPMCNACPSAVTAAPGHIQGRSSRQWAAMLTFRVDRVAKQTFILQQLQG